MRLAKVALIWAALAAAICVPIAFAATSPQLEWRGPVYILAGFAGIIALGLLLVQPLLIGGYLPGLSAYRGRRAHHWIGGALVVAVVIHVAGLWITSPPDMIDALTLRIADAVLPLRCDRHVGDLRRRASGGTPPAIGIATANVAHRSYVPRGGHRRRRTVVHAMLVEGTMETVSKAALCALVLAAAIKVMVDRRVWRKRATPRSENTAQSALASETAFLATRLRRRLCVRARRARRSAWRSAASRPTPWRHRAGSNRRCRPACLARRSARR